MISFEYWFDRKEWEWSELLNSYDSDIVDTAFCSLRLQIIVNLSTAEDYLPDLTVRNEVSSGVLKDALKSETGGKVFDL